MKGKQAMPSITEENSNMEDEDDMRRDDEELKDEEDTPFTKPGQEGISVYFLGEGLLKEDAELSQLLLVYDI